MKKYVVILHPDAEADLTSSYEWGRTAWGEKQARSWIRKLFNSINSRLTSMPLSCTRAPESAELNIEVRQLLVRRYRVLFIVEKKTVTVLHVRGPYSAG